jgi:hypothetical protein
LEPNDIRARIANAYAVVARETERLGFATAWPLVGMDSASHLVRLDWAGGIVIAARRARHRRRRRWHLEFGRVRSYHPRNHQRLGAQ